MKKAIEEVTEAQLPTLPASKRTEKAGRTANGIMFYLFAVAVLAFGIIVGLRGSVAMAIVLIVIAFFMAGIAGHNISGEMAGAIEKSKPIVGTLLKLVTAKLGK